MLDQTTAGAFLYKERVAISIIRVQKATDDTELITILSERIERLKKTEHASLILGRVGWFKLLMHKGGFGKKVDEVESLREVESMLAERIVL